MGKTNKYKKNTTRTKSEGNQKKQQQQTATSQQPQSTQQQQTNASTGQDISSQQKQQTSKEVADMVEASQYPSETNIDHEEIQEEEEEYQDDDADEVEDDDVDDDDEADEFCEYESEDEEEEDHMQSQDNSRRQSTTSAATQESTQTASTNQNNAATSQQQNSNQDNQYRPKQQKEVPRQDLDLKLRSNLTDMLINLYNGRPYTEFEKLYLEIIKILSYQMSQNQAVSKESLVNLFERQIREIMGTVKNKLNEDAIKEGLAITEMTSNQNNQNNAASKAPTNNKQLEKPLSQQYIVVGTKSYKDAVQKFDEILSAVVDYFELFKVNADKLEDLWLQLLAYFKLKMPSKQTIFKQTHYKTYIQVVIRDTVIKDIIAEATKFKGAKNLSQNLDTYLEKIKDIEEQAKAQPESYESFYKRFQRSHDMNKYASRIIKEQTQKQNQLIAAEKNKQQQNQKSQVNSNNNQQVDSKNQKCRNSSECKNASGNNGRQTNKQSNTTTGNNTNSGSSNFHHHASCNCANINSNTNVSDNQSSQAKKNKQHDCGKLAEGIIDSSDNNGEESGDEQVYKKDLDDLVAYIMEPQMGKKSKNKKTKNKKKNKQPSDEETPESQQDNTAAQAAQSSETPVKSEHRQQKQSNQSSYKNGNSQSDAITSSSTTMTTVTQQSSSWKPMSQSGNSFDSLSDQDFEETMKAFRERLDTSRNVKGNIHRKLRPNYDSQWLNHLSKQLETMRTSANSVNSSA